MTGTSDPESDEGVIKVNGMFVHTVESLGPIPKKQVQKGQFPVGDYGGWNGKHVSVYVVSCDSSLDVFVQLNGLETNAVLDQVAEVSVELMDKTVDEDFEKIPGTPCLALFEDGLWYRATVREDLGDGLFEVYFVDYGNLSRVKSNQLTQCPGPLVEFVEGITNVALHGFTGDESQEEVDILTDIIAGKDLVAKVEAVSFEIKGKTRMLLTLFGEDGTPVKTLVEEEVKRKRILMAPPSKIIEPAAIEAVPEPSTPPAPVLSDLCDKVSAATDDKAKEQTVEIQTCAAAGDESPIKVKESEAECSPKKDDTFQKLATVFPPFSSSILTTPPDDRDCIDGQGPILKTRTSSLPHVINPLIISISPEDSSTRTDDSEDQLTKKLAKLQDQMREQEINWHLEKRQLQTKIKTLEKEAELRALDSEARNQAEQKAIIVQRAFEKKIADLEASYKQCQVQLADKCRDYSNIKVENEVLDVELQKTRDYYKARQSTMERDKLESDKQMNKYKQETEVAVRNLETYIRSHENTTAEEIKKIENKLKSEMRKAMDDQHVTYLSTMEQKEKQIQELRREVQAAVKSSEREKMEKEDVQEQLQALEMEFEKLGKARSRGGSTMDVATLTPRTFSVDADRDHVLEGNDQGNLVKQLTDVLNNAVKTYEAQTIGLKSKIDNQKLEIAALRTQLSTALKNDPAGLELE